MTAGAVQPRFWSSASPPRPANGTPALEVSTSRVSGARLRDGTLPPATESVSNECWVYSRAWAPPWSFFETLGLGSVMGDLACWGYVRQWAQSNSSALWNIQGPCNKERRSRRQPGIHTLGCFQNYQDAQHEGPSHACTSTHRPHPYTGSITCLYFQIA
jgi:hypothetical protein